MHYDIYSGVQRYKTNKQKILLAAGGLLFAAALALTSALPVLARGGTQEPIEPGEPRAGSPMTKEDCANGGWQTYVEHQFANEWECRAYVKNRTIRDLSFFGDAMRVRGGVEGKAVQLRSDDSPGYGGINFVVPSGMTFADFQHLSTDFNPTDDGCAGGSPRFQLRVPEMGPLEPGDPSGDNIFVYLGPNPVLGTCALNTWQNTGDLFAPAMFVDTSQIGGTFYHEYSLAVTAYGSLPVSSMQLVVDASWAFADGEQTILIDNTQINGTLFHYY